MITNQGNMAAVFTGFKTSFNEGLESAPSYYKRVAMITRSFTSKELYTWLGQFPGMREWIGDRVIKNLAAHDFTVTNRDFETSLSIPRNTVEDDHIGVFTPIIRQMGMAAGEYPDDLVLTLLASGFTKTCFDGQYFFDTDHPVGAVGGDYPVTSVSNMQAGSGTPWFLLDTSRALKPLIWQERIAPRFASLDRPEDENVFMRKEFIYGADARGNAGFGLWQLAFGSKADLTPDNYEAARAAMMALKGDEGRPLNIKPDVLVAPPSLEGAVKRLLNNGSRIDISSGTPVALTNEWQGTAEPIITAWLI